MMSSQLPERLQNKYWRLTHLYKIKDKNGRLVTFRPNTVQLKHMAERGSHKRCRLVKARQHGMTTFYCIDYLDESLWVAGTSSAILAHEQKALLRIFDIVKRAYDNLPLDIKPKANADNTNELKFERRFDGYKLDSGIYVALKIRSGTVQNLHVTESAYIKNRQELKAGSMQAVPISGRITEETTGNGFNEFYDEYMEAYRNTNPTALDYKAFFYGWHENPDYALDGQLLDITPQEQDIKVRFSLTDGQLLWRRWKMKELQSNQEGIGLTGEQLFKQEYPMSVMEAFQSGAGSVFDLEKLEAIAPDAPMTEQEIIDECAAKNRSQDYTDTALSLFKMGVSFWRLPIPAYEYVCGVDPSDGQGSDNTCIDLWKKADHDGQMDQMAQFYGKLLPDDVAELTAKLCVFYNRAYVGVENNMLSTILFLSKIYDNYFFSVKIDEKTTKKTKKIGWNTNVQTREKMLDDFIIHFVEGLLNIRSRITLSEMKTFVRKQMPSGSYKREHADGKWDDSLFAAMIAIQMTLYQKRSGRLIEGKPFSY